MERPPNAAQVRSGFDPGIRGFWYRTSRLIDGIFFGEEGFRRPEAPQSVMAVERVAKTAGWDTKTTKRFARTIRLGREGGFGATRGTIVRKDSLGRRARRGWRDGLPFVACPLRRLRATSPACRGRGF